MVDHEDLAALVAAGRATPEEMRALGADRVREIKGNPDVPQIRVRASEPISVNEESRTISYLVSDETPDRVGDIIRVRGWDIASYKRNPVVLWAHDGKSVPPIGKANNVRRRYGPARLTADIEFAPKEAHEFADTIYQLASRGFVRATSVGFMPRETEEVDEKKREKLGLGPYGQLYTSTELMEISVVAVPANPSALQDGVKALASEGLLDSGMVARFFDTFPPTVEDANRRIRAACRSFVDFGAAQHLADSIAEPADDYAGEIKMAKPPHKTAKAPVGQKWDAASVWHAIADDYEGDAKAKRYWDIVAYRVPDADAEAQSSYKFPHHDADGKVVWRGVTAAMAALNGARGGAAGLSEKDREGVYRHLAAHYQQFEEEPPELRSMDDAEVKSPACRQEDETAEECVSRKVPEMIEEGMDEDQAVAAAHAVCEKRCDDDYKDEARLVDAVASLLEQQAEQTRATRQLVDALSDLTVRLHAPADGGARGGSEQDPEAAAPEAIEPSARDINEMIESASRGFAERVRRDLFNNNART